MLEIMNFMQNLHPLWYTGTAIVVTVIALVLAFRYTMKSLYVAFARPSKDTHNDTHKVKMDSDLVDDADQCPSLHMLEQELKRMKEDPSQLSDCFGEEFTMDDYEHIQARLKQIEQRLRVEKASGKPSELEAAEERKVQKDQLGRIHELMMNAGFDKCELKQLEQEASKFV